ncbi:F-box/LRR-repeat protein 5-like [Haliotis rubra]|uniref:F-box/LRR-repeat protein 5-like n=1 Tax=Haliotis rubra TaxID=36100 RepID=UPI001EE5E18E|nr:F-box/LRR-repeat protein 5-like [Haliotis rubra]
MAPEWPEEVDVFTVPHSRMKQLVHKYLDMMTSTNFSDVAHLRTLLENLCNTFREFRAHEHIENKYIMHKLKVKLRSLSITNKAVCNCHSDNQLSEMLRLVYAGYTWTSKTASERLNYGLQLRKALEDFTKQFLPHMEEEEEVFQPMLIKYFTYEELKEIKANVIKQHLAQHWSPDSHKEKCVEDALSSESSDEETDACAPVASCQSLPDEILLCVMSLLSPQDLARCAQVCQRWNKMALDSSLWSHLYPMQWAQGEWSSLPPSYVGEEGEVTHSPKSFIIDEDADVDESESLEDENDEDNENKHYKQAYKEWKMLTGLTNGLLHHVGDSVTHCSLAYSKGLTNNLLRQLLMRCGKLQYLDLSYTPISDAAFKGLSEGCCSQLRHLDLTGCVNITDISLQRLSQAMTCPHTGRQHNPVSCDTFDIQHLSQHTQVPTGTLPYSEMRKWLICDAVLGDLFERSQKCSSETCCGTEKPKTFEQNLKSVQVSQATLTHCSSSDIRQLVNQVRQHFVCNKSLTSSVCEQCENRTGLEYLSLSGCYQITDVGLRALSEEKCVRSLAFLDLSGCVGIRARGLSDMVSACQHLDHAQLFYCDNIADDPFAKSASGCQNLGCSSRFCCRLGY